MGAEKGKGLAELTLHGLTFDDRWNLTVQKADGNKMGPLQMIMKTSTEQCMSPPCN